MHLSYTPSLEDPLRSESDVAVPIRAGGSVLQRPSLHAVIAVLLAVLGVASIWPTARPLWSLWMENDLASIGMLVPLVSLVLILRIWRRLSWESAGSWWGLVVLLVAMAASWTQRFALLILVLSPQQSRVIPPPSMVAVLYVSGAVLLFGGKRLYRAGLFPVLLVWLVNPVPRAFSMAVDLPLQRTSAFVARGFAMRLGQHLTPDNLRLMFTPAFGMFIAPGCNGIRGAVTMAFIALIAGYLFRFRWYAHILLVVGAMFLGYGFNLLRLCALVLYYFAALRHPVLQNRAETADYIIGGILFLFAALLLFYCIDRLNAGFELPESPQAAERIERDDTAALSGRSSYARVIAMGAFVLLGLVASRSLQVSPPSSGRSAANLFAFPGRLGQYTRKRSWNEKVLSGAVAYAWAEYVPDNGGDPVRIGLSRLFEWHDPLVCHSVRGESPLWQGPLAIETADPGEVSFSSAFYNGGVTWLEEASTQCSGSSCNEFATKQTHFGVVYSRPQAGVLWNGRSRSVPVLLRVEVPQAGTSPDVARQQLTNDLRRFLRAVNVQGLASSQELQ